ncbi:hypothetical protein Tco_0016396 [Tanacetum coccineum]
MSWFSRCSWCEGPFNGGNCRCCTNVSFEDEFLSNPNPISNDETPVFSYPPSQPQTSSLDQWHCFHCKDPLEEGEHCKWCTCKWCGSGLSKGFCFICASSNGNSSIYDPNPNSFNDSQKFSYPLIRSGYQQKDRKLSQNDKTELGMEKTVQNQGQSPKIPKSESILKNQQSNRSRN